jgi:3-hydroxyisobutyrate dehydrogenase-like beta-hydroxyacid dehydrogenase
MRRKHRKIVGLIGLGIIGTRVATGLRAAGFHTYVWNRTPKPAPNFLPSPAEVAEVCEVVQVFVSDSAALMEVLAAMAPKLTPTHLIIGSATVGPEATLEAAKFVEDRGARYLDAPFTGSKLAAERSQLVYYVGADDATFLRAKPILEATSRAIVRCGGVGDAALLKVVTNQIAAVSIQALAEALAVVRKAGLSPDALASALEHNACRSGTMDLKLPKMIAGDFDPHFSLKHMFKDVQLGIHLANTLEVDTPAAAVAAGVMFGAIARGWGDLDFSALYKHYEEPASEAAAVPALDDSRAEEPGGTGESEPDDDLLTEETPGGGTESGRLAGDADLRRGRGDEVAAGLVAEPAAGNPDAVPSGAPREP